MLPANARDLTFKVPNTGLTSVVARNVMKRQILEFDLVRLQTAGFAPPRHEVIARDLYLLFLRVPRELDDFHAIAQRRWNRVEHIRGGDEKDAREIERDIEIVIAKRRILFRIEYFEKRRRRIAAEVGAKF